MWGRAVQLLPQVSLTAALGYVLVLSLGSLLKGTIGFLFVRGVFLYLCIVNILPPPPLITERTLVLLFSLLLHFFMFEVFLRIELGQRVFCQKQREPLVTK